MRYIIIGPRSIGKSTVGKVLAKKLNYHYFDFDEYVELKLNGIDIHIEKHSVRSYRTEEKKLLNKFIISLPSNCVFSVGGGTVASQFQNLNALNIKMLHSAGKIIYLSPSEDKKEAITLLFQREQKRKGNKTRAETAKLFELRKPIYEKISDLKIEVKHNSPSKIVTVIILQLSMK